jgi:hypothetical protein
MVKRVLLVLLLGLTGLMVAISPVAAQIASDRAICAPQVQAQVEDTRMVHHGHQGHVTPPDDTAAKEQKSDTALFSCCDHGCVLDISNLPDTDAKTVSETRVPADWSVLDRADLTGPIGLRRPPKA